VLVTAYWTGIWRAVLSQLHVLAGVAHADSTGDGRVVMGGGPAGSPSCSSFQTSTDATGAIATNSDDCTVTGSTPATVVAFAIPAADTNGGLTCVSSLTNIGWTASQTSFSLGGVQVDECSFTAPTKVSWETQSYLWSIGDPYLGHGDHDCDLDDFVLGIPVGCDITFSTNGDASNQLFVENAPFDVAPTNDPSGLVPFPEPGSFALLLLGMVTLPLLRRRVTQ
jgi:hypothetical protein